MNLRCLVNQIIDLVGGKLIIRVDADDFLMNIFFGTLMVTMNVM